MECNCKNCNFISKQEIKKEREFVDVISKYVMKKLKDKWGFGFNGHLVGSAKRKLVVTRGDAPWDLDYQLEINNKKLENIESKDLFNLKNDIKTYIEEYCEEEIDDDLTYNAELSTSVVTLNKSKEGGGLNIHYDFAILNSERKILRGKEKNKVYWNEIPKSSKAISRYKEIKGEMWDSLRRIYLNKKCGNDVADNGNKLSGLSIFAMSIKETLETFNKWLINC